MGSSYRIPPASKSRTFTLGSSVNLEARVAPEPYGVVSLGYHMYGKGNTHSCANNNVVEGLVCEFVRASKKRHTGVGMQVLVD